MLLFNKGFLRHLIILRTLHFQALSQIWLSKVNGPALLKKKVEKGFLIFFNPKSSWAQ